MSELYSFQTDGDIIPVVFSYAGWSNPKKNYIIKQCEGGSKIIMSGRISDSLMFGLPMNRNATTLFRMIEGRDKFTVFGEAEFYVWEDKFKKTELELEYWEDLLIEAQKIGEQRLHREIEQQLQKKPSKPCLKRELPKRMSRKQKELDDLLKNTQLVVGKRSRRKPSS